MPDKPGVMGTAIPIGNTTLHSLLAQGPAAIRAIAKGAGHRDIVPTRQEEEVAIQQTRSSIQASFKKPAKVKTMYARGMRFLHTKSGKKVVLLRANVDRTIGGVIRHEVECKGEAFLAREDFLEPL